MPLRYYSIFTAQTGETPWAVCWNTYSRTISMRSHNLIRLLSVAAVLLVLCHYSVVIYNKNMGQKGRMSTGETEWKVNDPPPFAVLAVILLWAESSGACLSTGALVVRWQFASIDSNSPNPPALNVFLVRCEHRADRGHSLGLEPLGSSVSLSVWNFLEMFFFWFTPFLSLDFLICCVKGQKWVVWWIKTF